MKMCTMTVVAVGAALAGAGASFAQDTGRWGEQPGLRVSAPITAPRSSTYRALRDRDLADQIALRVASGTVIVHRISSDDSCPTHTRFGVWSGFQYVPSSWDRSHGYRRFGYSGLR